MTRRERLAFDRGIVAQHRRLDVKRPRCGPHLLDANLQPFFQRQCQPSCDREVAPAAQGSKDSSSRKDPRSPQLLEGSQDARLVSMIVNYSEHLAVNRWVAVCHEGGKTHDAEGRHTRPPGSSPGGCGWSAKVQCPETRCDVQGRCFVTRP